ncbi:MAG TPA: hypothetical protein VIH82_11370 [Acidimicrobiia bacterium]
MSNRDENDDAEHVGGEVPEGVGPEVFRERLEQARRHGAEHGGHITLQDQSVYLDDIDSVEPEGEGHRSRVRLRNGLIIGGLTGAAIVAALATVRYRRRRQQ